MVAHIHVYRLITGAELREIQKQIDSLIHPTSPRMVADFMALRRDVMFLEFDTAVRHSMADTFLSTGNVQAYKVCTFLFPGNVQTYKVCTSFSTGKVQAYKVYV